MSQASGFKLQVSSYKLHASRLKSHVTSQLIATLLRIHGQPQGWFRHCRRLQVPGRTSLNRWQLRAHSRCLCRSWTFEDSWHCLRKNLKIKPQWPSINVFHIQFHPFLKRVTGCRSQVSGFRLQVTGYKLHASRLKSQVTSHRFQVNRKLMAHSW